jgi:acyl-CoA synthetase (AMP-forming)/AMP-acid ligase II
MDQCCLVYAGSTEVSADVTCQVVDRALLYSLQGPWLPAGKPIANMIVAVAQTTTSSSSSSREAGSQQQNATALTADAGNTTVAAGLTAAAEITVAKHDSSSRASSKGLLVPLPVGCKGEVWLAGPGLSAGYLTQQPAEEQQQQRFQQLQLQLQHLHQAAGILTTAAAHVDPSSCMQQQQQIVSVAAGPGVNLAVAAAQQQTWFRTGDLGRMQPDGKHSCLSYAACQVHGLSFSWDVLHGGYALAAEPANASEVPGLGTSNVAE